MKPVKVLLLSVICATLAVASGAIANAGSSSIVGISAFTGIGSGSSTGSACSLTGSSPATTFVCSNGQSQDGTDCTCTEYKGAMKGSGVGAGIITLDLVVDTSETTGSFIMVPSPGGAITCYATTGVGLMQAKTKLPILLFSVGGYECPGAGVAPGTFSGSYSVINPVLAAQSIPSMFPNASGSGAISGQSFSSGSSITFTMSGDLKKN
jgi:hypothetical protein